MHKKPSTAVLGIGNPLCRDDGLGICIVNEMQRSGKYKGLDIIDGGASPDLFSLLDENIKRLIIVDTLKVGDPPGTIYRLEVREENITDGAAPLHGLGVLDTVSLMHKLGMQTPEIIIIGVEPFDTSHGLGLTPQFEALVPAVVRAVDDELQAPH